MDIGKIGLAIKNIQLPNALSRFLRKGQTIATKPRILDLEYDMSMAHVLSYMTIYRQKWHPHPL